MREYIEPEVKSQLPAIFRSFKFTKMDMGDIPCRVGGIKVTAIRYFLIFNKNFNAELIILSHVYLYENCFKSFIHIISEFSFFFCLGLHT